MTYDPNYPIDPNDPNRTPGMHDPAGRYDGPHWGWYAALLALVIIGMVVVIRSDGDTTRTALNDGAPTVSAPETTGSAPRSSPAPITESAPNRGGAAR